MKITLLGTGAIGYPLAFCNCKNCKLARMHKGKSIRKCSSVLINEDMIIDLGPDVQTSMMMYDKDMGKIKYLLQTHVHIDHFDEAVLCARYPYNTISKELNKLEICAHPKSLNIMSERVNMYTNADLVSENGSDKLKVHVNPMIAGDIISFDNYKVKAIETTHDINNGSLLYVISQDNKNLFYAVDTPALTKNALNQLKGIKFDVVIMEHTFGNQDYSFSHLNEKLFIEQIKKLKEVNCIDDNTKIYGTHISHDSMSYHEEVEKRAIEHGYHIAYDGMEIEI